MPAYAYTCDQRRDPRALTPVNPAWQSPTNHWHQVGNDRIVALASNEGYVQVRQDEGSPKLLNDYDPKRGRFAGGFGYLTDGETLLSTHYPGHAESFERVFGLGYVEKRVAARGLGVDHVVFAPFGDDPLVISRVEISNRREEPVDLRWVEYWDATPYPLSFRSFLLSLFTGGRAPAAELRRQLAESFSHRIEPHSSARALVDTLEFQGRPWRDRVAWGFASGALNFFGQSLTGGPVGPVVPEAAFDDLSPAPTFLASLDAPARAMATDGARFFGAGGLAQPDGMAAPLPGLESGGSALLLERRLRLEAGASGTLHFAYGYLPEGVTLEGLIERYAVHPDSLWETSTRAWGRDRLGLRIPGEEWVDRELLWHHYYLRSNLTYDDFFREHILSQGHVYQYTFGFQGAARDPLQHALPFTFTDPEVVQEVLRYTLKEVQPDGSIPYGIVGHGVRMPAPFRPSDQEMWLLWLASEYVLATRDLEFLDEEVPTWPVHGEAAARATVADLLERCYRHLVTVTGTGVHGLMRLSNGDWNDGAVLGFVPDDKVAEVRENGESVLNAAFATYALDIYGRMLEFAGDTDLAGDARDRAEAQRVAVGEQWTGRWFRRQWLTEELGWIGDDVLWLEPQPWAIIGGTATPGQASVLAEAVDELLRRPSSIGAALLSQPLEGIDLPPGELTNGGVWPSINGTLVWALSRVDGERAWDEWRKNTLAAHAEAHPDVWYGIWSGPDSYNSFHSTRPGETFVQPPPTEDPERPDPTLNWTDFPVMNMHPHAWTLYDVVKLLGVEFTPAGVEVRPSLPQPEYEFTSPLLGIRRSPEGYEGWYAPRDEGTWEVLLALPAEDSMRPSRAIVNGSDFALERDEEGAVRLSGRGDRSRPLRWSLRYAD
jgi:hypothetical protein